MGERESVDSPTPTPHQRAGVQRRESRRVQVQAERDEAGISHFAFE